VRKPLVVLDEEHERVFERVAAVDVAKAGGVVCVRTPGRPGGPRQNRIFDDVAATTGAISELGRFLVAEKVQMVTMEATSDYWRIWYVVLEMAGLAVQLVSPHQARQIQGRPKTDKLERSGWPG
jgi:transposase